MTCDTAPQFRKGKKGKMPQPDATVRDEIETASSKPNATD